MASYWEEVLADAPTVLLEMQDASGDLTDSSGNSHPAVVSGAALTYHQQVYPDAHMVRPGG